MTITTSLGEALSIAAAQSDAWREIRCTVRFEIDGVAEQFTLGPTGEITSAAATHVLRTDSDTLHALTAGRLTFLRAVTSRKVRVSGPVFVSFAIGQALGSFGPIR